MRPLIAGSALSSSSRKQSSTDYDVTTPLANPGNGVPTTFFMTTESNLDASGPTASTLVSDSNYGVRSLEESPEIIEEAVSHVPEEELGNNYEIGGRRRSTIRPRDRENRERSPDSPGPVSPPSSPETSPARLRKRRRPDAGSQPLTPISFSYPTLESSIPGSPKSVSTRSLRQSDDDGFSDGGSQAIMSSGEEDGEELSDSHTTAPQLIMPSIMMPSRRPFTERGKALGRLKILFAGPSSAGKTSLIKSVVQLCEDIVHVDPIPPTSPILQKLALKKSKRLSQSLNSTKQVTEIYASTKAYPTWWSEVEESTVLKRRRSGGDTVLERNICFVDTPGHGSGTSAMEDMDKVFQYIESQMTKSMSILDMSVGDRLSILGGNGGCHVDVVFYMIQKDLQPVDVEFLKQLSRMTNVVPLIAKADTMLAEEIRILQSSVHQELQAAKLTTFNFQADQSDQSDQSDGSAIYSVCSSRSNDEDNMDASLLMSPDYVQPLLPSQLGHLLDQVFNKENASWLKHSAAKKALQWSKATERMATTPSPLRTAFSSNYGRSPLSPLSPTFTTLSSSDLSQVMVSYPNGALSYAQARITDHTQREERMAQIHLANWAGNLQRSLQNEKARYESLARAEQAAWLKERMDECVFNEKLGVAENQALITKAGSRVDLPRELSGLGAARCGLTNLTDPLGLMRWTDEMVENGWVAVRVIGAFGVLGATVVWIARNWGWGSWGGDWSEGFGGFGGSVHECFS